MNNKVVKLALVLFLICAVTAGILGVVNALTWERIPSGNYLYCFGLTDLSGLVHYTDSVTIGF